MKKDKELWQKLYSQAMKERASRGHGYLLMNRWFISPQQKRKYLLYAVSLIMAFSVIAVSIMARDISTIATVVIGIATVCYVIVAYEARYDGVRPKVFAYLKGVAEDFEIYIENAGSGVAWRGITACSSSEGVVVYGFTRLYPALTSNLNLCWRYEHPTQGQPILKKPSDKKLLVIIDYEDMFRRKYWNIDEITWE